MSDFSKYKSRLEQWEKNTLNPTLQKSSERQKEFTTVSGYPIRRLYTEADLAGWDSTRDLSFPGEPPYTRGIHATMHRARLWTMRQFAGFGAAEDTNQRFRYLLSQGQTGLSTAFDLPTLMGYDSDHALCRRRSRKVRSGHQFPRRHGSSLRSNPSRRRNNFDDHQFSRRRHMGHVSCRRGKTGCRLEENFRYSPERHPEGIHRTKGIYLSTRTIDAPGHRHLRVRSQEHPEIQLHLHQRLPHSRSRFDRHSGACVHPCATAWSTSNGPCAVA